MEEVAVSCDGVSKSFGSVRAVEGATLEVPPGAFLAILGPSGCGKTTLLRLIAGFERPDEGTIKVAGRLMSTPKVHTPPEQRRVGMVFQDYAIFPHLTVSRNVAYGLSSGDKQQERISNLLQLVGLSGLENRMPHQLSGGEQQRVALARALGSQPEVILLDEPFSNLDAQLRVRVRGEVREILREAGVTVLFVTHDQEEAMTLADAVAVMWQGHILQVARPEELYLSPRTREVATLVGAANFLPAQAAGNVIHSEIGQFICQEDLSGPLELMVRPESIRLRPSENSAPEVIGRQYFGHDQLVTIRLASQGKVTVRTDPADANILTGQKVSLEVLGQAIVYDNEGNQMTSAFARPSNESA